MLFIELCKCSYYCLNSLIRRVRLIFIAGLIVFYLIVTILFIYIMKRLSMIAKVIIVKIILKIRRIFIIYNLRINKVNFLRMQLGNTL